MKIGFLGLGVMGLPMVTNIVKKINEPVYGYDVIPKTLEELKKVGGHPISDATELYKTCDIIIQMLPTHPIIINSVESAIKYGKPGNVIIDMSSTSPDIILDLNKKVKNAKMHFLDSPVSGGNPGAIAGTTGYYDGWR